MRKVSIIGAGRLGGALAIALDRSGYSIESIVFRGDKHLSDLKATLPKSTRFSSADAQIPSPAEIAIIASGDPDILAVAERLSHSPELPRAALHTSGSLSSEILSPLAALGVATASMHPLAAISDPRTGASRFDGAYFCVEGHSEAVQVAEEIVRSLGGVPFSIPTRSKALYHAAAVMSAGHVVALLDAAIEMMSRCGLSLDDARRVITPLANGSVANLADKQPGQALTGPYARGDAGALERHLEAFRADDISTETRRIYLELAARSIEIAARQGGDVDELRERILIAKERAGC